MIYYLGTVVKNFDRAGFAYNISGNHWESLNYFLFLSTVISKSTQEIHESQQVNLGQLNSHDII